MAFPNGTGYADSDADDEYERSVMTSPTALQTDSEGSSGPSSSEHTPTTFDAPGDDRGLPRTIITEWTPEECAQFVASLNLRQYCDAFIEHGIVGEALVALKHDELKEMGVASVGHRLTILKQVYEVKIEQDIPVEVDDYVPLSAEQNPRFEMATKEDIARIARSIIKLRDDRIAQTEAQLTRLADDYRKLRQEMLPLFKQAKERSDPLPYAPLSQQPTAGQDIHPPELSPPTTTSSQPEKSSLTRTFSKKLGLGSTPKGHSPTHLPNTIHEDYDHKQNGLNPSAAATAASNQLTAGMSGGAHPQPSPGIPSPTSPMPYQPLAPRSYQRDPYQNDNNYNQAPTYEPPSSAKSANSGGKVTPGYKDGIPPSRDQTSSAPPGSQSNNNNNSSSTSAGGTNAQSSSGGSGGGTEAPQIEIFKSFKVSLEDPCWKVLPAALNKYNIHADWRQYALYIVYGDQERSVGLEEKPLALFKELDREGKKPMFMLRKLGNPMQVGGGAGGGSGGQGAGTGGPQSAGIGSAGSGVGMKGPDSGGRLPGSGGVGGGGGGGGGGLGMGMATGMLSSAASVRTMGARDPPGGVI